MTSEDDSCDRAFDVIVVLERSQALWAWARTRTPPYPVCAIVSRLPIKTLHAARRRPSILSIIHELTSVL